MRYTIIICLVCLYMFSSCLKHVEKKSEAPERGIIPPVLMKKVEPLYPENARSNGMTGTVNLSLYVTETGEVSHAVVTSSSAFSDLDEAAQQYAVSLKFTPAMKGADPIGVWLSWVVHYDLLQDAASFNMNEYIDRIQTLRETLSISDPEEKEDLQTEIIKVHEEYFNYIRENPDINLNSDLQLVLDNSVIQQWQEFWKFWPLTFVVMQDFDRRYPVTRLKSYAIDLQIKQVVEDLERVKKSNSEEKDKFYHAVYNYLKENYPKSLENSRKEDLQLYLKY